MPPLVESVFRNALIVIERHVHCQSTGTLEDNCGYGRIAFGIDRNTTLHRRASGRN